MFWIGLIGIIIVLYLFACDVKRDKTTITHGPVQSMSDFDLYCYWRRLIGQDTQQYKEAVNEIRWRESKGMDITQFAYYYEYSEEYNNNFNTRDQQS